MPRTPPPEGRRFAPGDTRGVATRFQPGDNPVGAETRFQRGQPPPAGRPFVRGHDPRREPGKALAGRKTEKFKALCRTLLDDKTTQAQVRAVLSDGNNRNFVKLYRTLCEYAYGKPTQSVAVTGEGGTGPVEIIVTRRIIRAPQRDGDG